MSSDNRQILELLKRGLTIEEVAASLNYPVEAIEIIAQQQPQIAAEANKSAGGKDFTEADEQLADTVIKDVAQYGETDGDRLKAAFFIKEQRLGLKKPKESQDEASSVLKIAMIADRVLAARERAKALREKTTDVEASVTPAQTQLSHAA